MRAAAVLVVVMVGLVVGAGSAVADSIIVANDATHGAGSITRDTIQGLDFLDVTLSTNRSASDVSSEFDAGGDFEGFRYATAGEVVALINNYGFDPGAIVGTSVVGESSEQLAGLIAMLGITYTAGATTRTYGLTGTDHSLVPGSRRTVLLIDRGTVSDLILWGAQDSTSTNSAYGSFLVRPVPEPGTLALVGLGVVGLAGWRVRKRRRAR